MYVNIKINDGSQFLGCSVFPKDVKSGDKPIKNKEEIEKLLSDKNGEVALQNVYMQAKILTKYIKSFEIFE